MSANINQTYTLDDIADIVIPILKQYASVDRAFIFGSYAKGSADSKSDVDIHIDADKIRTLDLCGLMVRLERSLGKPTDVIPTDSMSPVFLNSIKGHEVLIYER
ncbi:MAG: nucleotidyltransferase domain-containing protein [Candidatus Methanoplasma sp.]|nr:nucleotidyltransferase domain-containing protein [Candidatus Methanoplasma sp.]